MANLSGFDASKVEPNTVSQPVPAGDYVCIIESSEIKPTKDGEGKYLELVLQIAEGEHKGRKLWDRLNIWNKSEKAVQIAQGTLSSICRAVGVLKPDDSSELHGRPLLAIVKCREYQGNVTNEIKGYKSAKEKNFTESVDENGSRKKKPAKEAAPWD